MSKHTNKHWLREKEYISLIKERDLIWDSLPRYRRLYSNNRSNSRLVYINQRLEHKFFNEYCSKNTFLSKVNILLKNSLFMPIPVSVTTSFIDVSKD